MEKDSKEYLAGSLSYGTSGSGEGGRKSTTVTRQLVGLLSYITYIPTTQGWLYVAVILDLYSRMVVGWSMSGNGDGQLVEHVLDQALARRRPKAGLLHHSARGRRVFFTSISVALRAIGDARQYVA